jgi:hypothetical protein
MLTPAAGFVQRFFRILVVGRLIVMGSLLS